MNPFAIVLAIITWYPRRKVTLGVDFVWSKSWAYNLFRVFELIFWRKDGIRIETSTRPDGNGGTITALHSWESVAVYAEIFIRSFFKFKFPYKIWIPILSTPEGLPVFASPYLFAIAFDTSALSSETNNGGQSWTHTVTGSNPILIAMDVAETSTTDPYSSMTYNSVAMTAANSKASSNRFIKAWYMNNPPTGSSLTIQPTLSPNQFNQGASSSFSGVNQTGIDNSATAAAGGTTQSVTITPTASDGTCWGIIGTISDGGGVYTVIAGTTQRQAGSAPMHYGDSNGVIPSGSGTQLGWTTSLSSNWAAIAITITPPTAASTFDPARFFPF